MADPEGSRKLVAILAADVAGYSLLMQDDDEATVTTLEAYRAVFRETIQAHRGRVVDMAGDSVLAVSSRHRGMLRRSKFKANWLAQRRSPEARPDALSLGVNLERSQRPDGTVYGDGVMSRPGCRVMANLLGSLFRHPAHQVRPASRVSIPRRARSEHGRPCVRFACESMRRGWLQAPQPPQVRCPRSPCRTSLPSQCCRSTTCRAIQSRTSLPTAWLRLSPRPCPGFAPFS